MSAWSDWITRHATLFALHDQRDQGMLAEWARLFSGAGFAPDDALAATDWVAANNPPEFRSQHLARLLDRLRSSRGQLEAKRARPVAEACCRDCGDVGLVIVPDPDGIERWHNWRERVVFCSCSLGRWKAKEKPQLETLPQYQAAYPRWREMARWHDQQVAAQGAAEANAEGLDKAMGQIIARAKVRARN